MDQVTKCLGEIIREMIVTIDALDGIPVEKPLNFKV